MDVVNVDFVRNFVVPQGQTHSIVSLLLLRSVSWKVRGPLEGFALKWNTRAKSAVIRRAGILHERSCCSVGYFCLEFFFFCKEKIVVFLAID